MEYLHGLIVKNWKVIEYDKKGVWICECMECGRTDKFRAYHLKAGRVRECLHEVDGSKHKSKGYKNDLTGKTFGELTVKEFIGNRKWLCECSCGNFTEVNTYSLTSGHTKSCGHNSGKLKDMVGQRFGELLVKEYVGDGKWLCECSCGKFTNPKGTDLRSGNTTSCGHTRAESRVINLIGEKFGDWEVIEHAGGSYWRCKCSCGDIYDVHSYSLRSGASTRCTSTIHRMVDLTNRHFGMLKVVEYLGSKFWKCECDCGNSITVRACNLVNGSTQSCGCMSHDLMVQTLIERYGEVNPRKIYSKRTSEQLNTLYCKELLSDFIDDLTTKLGCKPHLTDIAKKLNMTASSIKRYLDNYELLDKIQTNSGSSMENELYLAVAEMYCGDVIRHSRKIIAPYELDIYIPDLKLAIEFNGSYWHSENSRIDKHYHQNKVLKCKDLGIDLIHIYDYEWMDSNYRDKLLAYLRSLLTKDTERIFARKTEIKQISTDEAIEFLNKNHLQGYTKSSLNIGCYYNNEIVGVITLGKPRFNNEYDTEIIRLCWDNNKHVVGGAAKLFRYVLENYNLGSIISYCNIDKFSGDVYERLGFQESHITEPGYTWVNTSDYSIVTRYQAQKHKLIAAGLGTEDETEDDIMHNLGYYKVYNSGNKVFIYEKEY